MKSYNSYLLLDKEDFQFLTTSASGSNKVVIMIKKLIKILKFKKVVLLIPQTSLGTGQIC